MQTKTEKWHGSSIFLEDDAAQTSNPIGRAMDKEAVEMFATPIEGTLKNSWSSAIVVSLATSKRRHTSGLTPQSTTRSW
jgi:hypothetical protein